MLLQTYGKICDYTTICFVVIESSYDENRFLISVKQEIPIENASLQRCFNRDCTMYLGLAYSATSVSSSPGFSSIFMIPG